VWNVLAVFLIGGRIHRASLLRISTLKEMS
jgi:hypothetical protein